MADIALFSQRLAGLMTKNDRNEIMQTNLRASQYALRLTEADAEQIMEARDNALKGLGRMEFGPGIAAELIASFCDSPYIDQAHYAETICDLLELFYYLKNELHDEIGDTELIAIMKDRFHHYCHGALDLLAGREADRLIQEILDRPAGSRLLEEEGV